MSSRGWYHFHSVTRRREGTLLVSRDPIKWYVPDVSELALRRASLDLGLRDADLYYRDRVVPGTGGVRFVRALSWSAAAFRLAAEISGARVTQLARAIEALACKAEWQSQEENASDRIVGKRAFARDPAGKTWSFKHLLRPENYVQNTWRQVASRPLRDDGGLGFLNGTRYSTAALAPAGESLAEALLARKGLVRGGMRLDSWLKRWIAGDVGTEGPMPNGLARLLSPGDEHVSTEEKGVVWERLAEAEESEETAWRSARRHDLARILRTRQELPKIETELVPRLRSKEHAADTLEARHFGRMYDAALAVVGVLTVVAKSDAVAPSSALQREDVGRSLEALRVAASNYRDCLRTRTPPPASAKTFVDIVLQPDEERAIRHLVGSTRDVLVLSDQKIHRGHLFRVITEGDEPIEEGAEEGATEQIRVRGGERTFRLLQFHELARDSWPGRK